ncbi:MAG: hypothetical protein WD049_05020 [Candidatus Paceibacterota bacterium]
MQEIILIGTIHSGWTPVDELRQVLAEQQPDKVLVELSPEELKRSREDSIRDEMFTAHDWAVENDVPVGVFDVENHILKEGVTGKEPAFTEYEQKSKEILNGYTWKELNNEKPWQSPEITALEEQMNKEYIDVEKSKQREQTMLENIKDDLIERRNVVVTGTRHLSFFKQNLPDAEMLLRE